jgi:tetratricopeptide (TPR) repeat protein
VGEGASDQRRDHRSGGDKIAVVSSRDHHYPAAMQRRVVAVSVGALAVVSLSIGCRRPPVMYPALAAADAELLQGCYDCLLSARASYRRLAGTDRARAIVRVFEADLLIALRERELDLPASDALTEARNLAAELPRDVEAERYVALVEAVPGEALGRPRAEVQRFRDARLALESRLDAEHAWLSRGTLRQPVREYLRLALECVYPGLDKPQQGSSTPAGASPDAPLLAYRKAMCGLGEIAQLAAVRAREPRFVETAFFIGNVELALAGRDGPGQARAHLGEAFARFPTSPAITYLIGHHGVVVEDHREALAFFDRTLALRASHDLTLLGRTIALSRLQRHEEAIDAATRLIAIGVGSLADAYYWRASNRHALGQLTEARADITEAKERGITPDIFTLAGIIEHDQRDLDPAQADLEAALAITDQDCTAHWYLGLVHRQRKTWSAAGQAFQNAISCYRERARRTEERIHAFQARADLDPAYRARALAGLEASSAADTRQWHLAALTGASCEAAAGNIATAKSLVDIASEDPTLAERAAKLRAWLDKPPRP